MIGSGVYSDDLSDYIYRRTCCKWITDKKLELAYPIYCLKIFELTIYQTSLLICTLDSINRQILILISDKWEWIKIHTLREWHVAHGIVSM